MTGELMEEGVAFHVAHVDLALAKKDRSGPMCPGKHVRPEHCDRQVQSCCGTQRSQNTNDYNTAIYATDLLKVCTIFCRTS